MLILVGSILRLACRLKISPNGLIKRIYDIRVMGKMKALRITVQLIIYKFYC